MFKKCQFIIPVAVLVFGFSVMGRAQNISGVKIEEVNAYIKNAGHPLIINFWATWCKPCVEEIPALQMAAEQYKDAGVELVMVSLDFPEAFPNVILDFIYSKNLHATFFWLDETNADHFCPVIDSTWQGSIPATLLVSGKNNYRKFYEKKITPQELDAGIKAMLE